MAISCKALPCYNSVDMGHSRDRQFLSRPLAAAWREGFSGWRLRPLSTSVIEGGRGRGGTNQQAACGFARGVTNSSFPWSPDLTSLLTGARPAGLHLSGLQPSAGQFFASLDPINEASAILSPLSSNPRNSVQHQFQDTFPGMERADPPTENSGLTPHVAPAV